MLNGQTLAEIQQPQYIKPDCSSGQCLGWRTTRIGDRVYHNHGGGIHGFATHVWLNVPSKADIVVLINMWPSRGGLKLPKQVLEIVLKTDEANRSTPSRSNSKPTPGELRPLLGHYCAAPGIHVDIKYYEGELRFANRSDAPHSLHTPAKLESTDRQDEWLVHGGRAAGEIGTFKFDSAGRVRSYEIGTFVFKKLDSEISD